ncbi:MAG: glycine betaine ABC transporter substrate-binding protein [Calditrichaceae bacterium]
MTRNFLILILILFLIFIQTACVEKESNPIKIGSKKFTESVILGEIIDQLAQLQHLHAEYKSELGGTRVLWNALTSGDIDIYPEYSGTILNEILSKTGITRISDLARFPHLKFGFTNEFMDRADGWPALQRAYNLPQINVRGLDHDLAYKALESGAIDLTDLYSTDAEIKYYHLVVLRDDRNHFPEYNAWLLARKDMLAANPLFEQQLKKLKNTISGKQMINMNARAKIDGEDVSVIASNFLWKSLNLRVNVHEENWLDRLIENTRDHLLLVVISLFTAILIAIPLGIIATRFERTGRIILSVTGIIQTIPSLAILVFMIPLLGIGAYPAMMALFLYSLLPIVRNTYSGIMDIPAHLSESAIALGLKDWERLRFVEIPLSLRSILSGIKTAAVINVGTATLGALIGAGGYGQPILTGIRLDDTGLILQGAVPAAILALMVQGFFDLIEKRLVKH